MLLLSGGLFLVPCGAQECVESAAQESPTEPAVSNDETVCSNAAELQERSDTKPKHITKFFWFNAIPQVKADDYHHTFNFGNGRSTEEGIVVNHLSVQTCYKLDCPYCNAFAGIQQTENSTSVSIDGTYWFMKQYYIFPSILLKNRVGVELLYNFQYLSGISGQNNVYIGLNTELSAGRYISFDVSALYGAKFSNIFALNDVVPYIFNNDFAFKLVCTMSLPYRLHFMLSMRTYEDFYYPLFCAPTYSAGIKFGPLRGFQISGEVGARYTDMFTLSSYLDCFWYRLVVGYTFK